MQQRLNLGGGGGCAAHEIYFCWDDTFEPLVRLSPMPEESEQVRVVLHHNANDDIGED